MAAQRRLLLEWFGIALLAIAAAWGLSIDGVTTRLDNAIYDALERFDTPEPSDQILIVAIDDPSIAAIGRWPWPRDVHARMLERVNAADPAAIVYDVLLTEASPDPANDRALSAAMRGGRVALPILVDAPGANGRAFDIVLPIEPERSAAAALGHVVLPRESDGVGRRALLAIDQDGRRWPHLIEEAYRLLNGTPSPAFRRAERRGNWLVNMPYAPAGSFRTVPFKDVLAGRVPPQLVRGRILLVGAMAGGLGDHHIVPGSGRLAGVEVQANLLSALIADQFVTVPPIETRQILAALPSLLLLLLFLRLSPAHALLASLTVLVVTAAIPVLLLLFARIWLPPTPALLTLLAVYPVWGWRRLHAMHGILLDELLRLENDKDNPAQPSLAGLDATGNRAAALGDSIARLRDLKQLVADTVESVGDPLIVTSMGGEILLANRRAQSMIGEEFAPALIKKLAGPDEAGELILAGGHHFSPHVSPLTGGAGEQLGWILLLAEITAIRSAERDREEALEFLSHDMRSPQAAIISLLEGETGKGLDPRLASRLAGYARRTLRLADDFVQLARLPGTRFEPEATDLCDSLAEAADALWPLATRKGVRIVTHGGEEPCWLMGEHHALTRALLNLLDNAVKFSPENARIECTLTTLEEAGEHRHLLAIEDSGPGVLPERLPKLFERFGPIAQGGAGLGLSYAHAVAERHGGTLQYSRAAAGGACFILSLPAMGDLSDLECSLG